MVLELTAHERTGIDLVNLITLITQITQNQAFNKDFWRGVDGIE